MNRILHLTGLLLLFFLVRVQAQPLNNDCSGAILLKIDTVKVWSTFSITNATNSGLKSTCDSPIDKDVYFKAVIPTDMDFNYGFGVWTQNVSLTTPNSSGRNIYDLGCDIIDQCSGKSLGCLADDDIPDPNQITYMPNSTRILNSNLAGKTIYIRISDIGKPTSGSFQIALTYTKKKSSGSGNNGNNSFNFNISPLNAFINFNEKKSTFSIATSDNKCKWKAWVSKSQFGYVQPLSGTGNATCTATFLDENSSYSSSKEMEITVEDCKGNKHIYKICQNPKPEPTNILFIEDFAFYSRYSSQNNNVYELNGEVIAINWKAYGGKNNIPPSRPSGTVLGFPQGVKVNLNNNYIGSLTSNAEIKIKEVDGRDYNLFYFLPNNWLFKIDGNELKPFFTTTVNAGISYMNFNTQLNTAILTKYKPDETIAGITYTGGFDLVDFLKKPSIFKDTFAPVSIKFSGYNYYRQGRCFALGLGGKYVYAKKFEIELSAKYDCNLRLFQGSGNLTLPHKKFGDITANAELEKNKLKRFGILVRPVKGIKALTPYLEFYQVGFEYELNPSGHIKMDGAIRPISVDGLKTEKLANISANFKYNFGSSFSFGNNLNILGHNIGLTNFHSNFSTLQSNLALNINKKLSLDLGLNIGNQFALGGSAGFEALGKDFTLGKGFIHLNNDRFLGSAYNKLAGYYGYVSLEYGMQSTQVALDFNTGFYRSKPFFAEIVDDNLKKYFGIASNSKLINNYNYFVFNESKRRSGPNYEYQNDEYQSVNDEFSYIFTLDKPIPQLKIKLSNTINGSIFKNNLELKKFNSHEILLYKPALGTYILKSDQKVIVDFENFYDIPSIIIKNATIANDKISIDFDASAPNQNAFLEFYLSEKKENEKGILLADSISVSNKNIVIDISKFNPSKYYIYAKIIGDISSNSTLYDNAIYIKEINPSLTKNFEVYNENDTLKLSFENDTNEILNYYQLFVNDDSNMLFTNTSRTFGIGYTNTFNFYDPELLPLGNKNYIGVAVVDTFGRFTNRSEIKSLNFISKNKNNAPCFKSLKSKYVIEPGKALNIQLQAFDLDNDVLKISIENSSILPSTFTLIGNKLNLNPSNNDVGFYKVVLKVSDGKNYSTEEISISVLNASALNPQLDFNKGYFFKKEIASFYVMHPNTIEDSLKVKIYTTKDKVGVDLFAKREAYNSNYFVNKLDLKLLKLLKSDSIFIKYIEKGIDFIDFAHYQEPNLDFNFKDSICSGSETFLFNTSKGEFTNFKWYLDGKFIRNSIHLFNVKTPITFGDGVNKVIVKLIAFNDFKDSFEFSKTLTLYNLPIAFPKKYAACISKPSEVSAVFKTNGISHLNWMSLDTNVKIEKNKMYLKAKDTNYNIIYSLLDQKGCTNSDTINIIGVYPPKASFECPNAACENVVVNIKNTTKTSSPLGFTNLWLSTDNNTIFSRNFNSNISYKNYGEKSIFLIASTAVGCSDTSKKIITINPNPIPKLSINADKNYCEYDTFTFKDLSTPVLGRIIQSAFSTDNFVLYGNEIKTSYANHGEKKITLKSTNSFGCTSEISDTLKVYALPRIKLYYSRIDSCEYTNQNKIWSVVSTPDNQEFMKKHWNFEQSTMDSIKLQFRIHGTNTVYFSAKTKNHCSSNDSIKIKIYPQGVPHFQVRNVCLGEITQFENASYDANFSKFIWTIDGQNFENKHQSFKFKTVGKRNFLLKSITDKGCENEKSGQTEVFSLPKAKLSYQKVDTLFSDFKSSVYVFDAKNSRDAQKYNWYFNSTLCDTTFKFSKQFADTTSQYLILIVKNNNGCRDSQSLNLVPTPKHVLYIPNAFSANNDGLNDMFIPIGNPYCKSYLMEIYNRWGQKIFETTDRNLGWDGENFMGVYMYKITIQELDGGKWHYYSGIVTVLK